MYKWPQGRLIRSISLLLVLIIGVDLAWAGSWVQLDSYFDPATVGRNWSQLAVGIIYGLLALGVLVGGAMAAGFMPKTVDFLIEVEQEMTRVTWPTGNELLRSTLVIALMIVVLAVFILVVDWVNVGLVQEYLFHRKG